MAFATRLFWLGIWGAAFGFIESAVVVYLRKIYYPEGFSFPLVPIESTLLLTETAREAATLLLIWSTAALSYRMFQSRVAAFFILFGVWDIFYYIFLKILLDWPASVSEWDILFLIPLPWVGPVWAPVAVSAALILFSVLVLRKNESGTRASFTPFSILTALAGAAMIVASFIICGLPVSGTGMPGRFPAPLFWTGFFFGVFAYIHAIYGGRKPPHSLHDRKIE